MEDSPGQQSLFGTSLPPLSGIEPRFTGVASKSRQSHAKRRRHLGPTRGTPKAPALQPEALALLAEARDAIVWESGLKRRITDFLKRAQP